MMDQSQGSRQYENTSARDQEIHLPRRSEKYIQGINSLLSAFNSRPHQTLFYSTTNLQNGRATT
jgi:hypothetical protein